jgi:two-component system phosphate regulon sensor histidine kinase PhoR
VNIGFSAEVKRIVFFTFSSILFGLINGYLAWTLIISGIIYIVWILLKVRALDNWLQDSSKQPPDTGGIWGHIFNNIARQQKQQRDEQSRLQAVISRSEEITTAMHNGIILLNVGGEIELLNPAATRLIGLRDSDLGFPLVNYIRHPEFIAYFESGKYSEPLDLPSPRNHNLFLQYQITRFGLGKSLVVIRDITHLHQLEMMRKDFVANVSHELRTPLTVLRGYIETLLDISELDKLGLDKSGLDKTKLDKSKLDMPDQGASPAVTNTTKALTAMDLQAKRMNNIINDLLVLSRLQSAENKPVKQFVDIAPLLQQVVAEAQVLSGDLSHTIELRCDPQIHLPGNDKELYSAFSNLIFNAVKYSFPQSTITIDVSVNLRYLNVSVTDQSEGIASVHIPRLTERFYRVDDSRHSATGGTGLGLAIVKHVLMRHNGELKISSRTGKGSTFTCVFAL